MGDGLQDPSLGFELLYEQARQSVPILQDLGDAILCDLKTRHPGLFADAKFEMGALKRLDRATDKIIGDYKGNHAKIYDLARGRIIIDTAEQIEVLRTYFQENAEDLGVESLKDRFTDPSDTGFRDINMKMRLPNGHVIEFRVEHRAMMESAKITHGLYEEIQEIKRKSVYENRNLTEEEESSIKTTLDEIRDIHRHPAKKANLDRLLSDKGWKILKSHERERGMPRLSDEEMTAKIARLAKELADKKKSVPEEPDISMEEALVRLFNFHNRNKIGNKSGSAKGSVMYKTHNALKHIWKKDI